MKQHRNFVSGVLATLLSIVYAPVASAQASILKIGVLTPGGTFAPVFLGLREGLGRLDYRQEKNLAFVIEDTQGMSTGLVERARKVLAANPDVLFAVTTPYALAAKQATPTVPVVFALVGDPLRAGLVASYLSSKNNLTGVISYVEQLSGKRLEILKEIAPKIEQVLILVQPEEIVSQRSFQLLEEAAKKLRIRLIRRDVTTREEIEKALAQTSKGSVDAIYHVPSILVAGHVELLNKKAINDKIPLAAQDATLVERGALFSYGPDYRLVGTQSARLVAKVLKGEKPSDIPVETPEKFFLTVNVTTAKAIGLKIPRSVLERVDRVVE